jgi:hypothetical protein
MSEEMPVAPEMDPQGEPMPVTPHATIIRQGLLRTAALGGIVAGMSLCGCTPRVVGITAIRRPANFDHHAQPAASEPQADTDVSRPTMGVPPTPALEMKERPQD